MKKTIIALSVIQPWASLIALGVKKIECRTWKTPYRGALLVCSSKTIDQHYKDVETNFKEDGKLPDTPLLRGYALAIVDLIDCRPMTRTDEPDAGVMCTSGTYAWVLANVRTIKPFAVKGSLGLFSVDFDKGWEEKLK